jgi:hypothetical protein
MTNRARSCVLRLLPLVALLLGVAWGSSRPGALIAPGRPALSASADGAGACVRLAALDQAREAPPTLPAWPLAWCRGTARRTGRLTQLQGSAAPVLAAAQVPVICDAAWRVAPSARRGAGHCPLRAGRRAAPPRGPPLAA